MLKFVGEEKGLEGLPNVPARDLSDEEIEERRLNKKALIKSGLYREVKPKKKSEEA